MSLYTRAQGVSPATAARQAVQTVVVDPARFEELASLVEAALPNAVLNEDALANGGIIPGTDPPEKIVPFAVKQVQPTKASVTFYYNGKVVFAGIEPIALP